MNLSPFTDASIHLIKQNNEKKSKFTCIPIGLTQGQFNLNAFKIAEEFKWFQMRSACILAFCHIYIQDPLKWSSQTINTILINGAKLVKDNYVRVKENGPVDCVLNIENYVAKIRTVEPVFVSTFESNTSLVENLQIFFNDRQQHGLFRCLNLCYLIWKTNGIYFLFDAQGNGSSIEDKNGFASLVCTESLKDVCKLLKTISYIKSDDCYSLSPITMKHFRKGVKYYTNPRIQYAGTSTYTIVSDCFAILSGKFHIGHSGFQLFKNRQSMAVGLMALIYNEIQPCNSWNSQVIDKIILLGTKLFQECKKTPQGEVTIQHLPRAYKILQYSFRIDFKPYDHSGQLSYSIDEMKKNLLMYLQQAFEGAVKKTVLIQTDSLAFAVWECNDYYYILDAYARTENGEIANDQIGAPCIHMHGNLESLCSVLCTNLNAIGTRDGFLLHGVKVVLECNDDGKVSDHDLESINSFMDDLFWTEMSNFKESSARSEDICNLDELSDDDIFMETVGGLKKSESSIDSSASGSITSFASESGTSGSISESSQSNSQSNEDAESQVSSKSKKEKQARTKSPKREVEEANEKEGRKNEKEGRKNEKEGRKNEKEGRKNEKEGRKNEKEGRKNEKEGRKNEKEGRKKENEGNNEQMDEEADEQSKKKQKRMNSKNKGKKARLETVDEAENSDNGDSDNQSGKKSDSNGKRKLTKSKTKQSLVVVESASGTETSVIKLLTTSFKISDRVLLVTKSGDFFVAKDNDSYFLMDGCFCDYNALIQIDLTELDSSKRLKNIGSIVKKIMLFKGSKSEPNVVNDGDQNSKTGDGRLAFSGDVDASFWELIEGMIELMKTTAKFDKIKNEMG